LSSAVLFLLVISSGIGVTLGQKKPTALKLDADADDKMLCSGSASSQFCDYYEAYKTGATPELKAQARNEMIDLLRGQIDTYYKLRKDGRKAKIRWLQSILDFLEIGGSAAIGIMNGARDKTITGIAIGVLQGTRTSVNRNFEILQTQVLINKMNANRAEIFTEIARNKTLKPSDYSWYAAKNDLRRYLFAGTFNNALDSLVNETGADVTAAENTLRIVEARPLVPSATPSARNNARRARVIKDELRADLAGTDDAKKAAATRKLQSIVAKLEDADEAFAVFLDEKGVTSSTANGQKIYDALQEIIEELPEREGRRGRDLADRINQIFIEVNTP
jgi:hypothetical protein